MAERKAKRKKGEIREKESDRRGVEGEESLPYLPKELWMLVASHVHHNDMFAFVSTCTQFREIHKEMKPQRNLKSTALLEGNRTVSRDWLRWVFGSVSECNYTWKKVLAELAVWNGYLDVLRELRGKGCPWREWSICYVAAQRGHLDVLKWLDSQGCHWNDWLICKRAIQNGHLEVLRWLVGAKGCRESLDEYACCWAAEGGHLQVMRWLHQEGYTFNEWLVCKCAAEGGQLEMLRWLREELGCALHADMCEDAASEGHLDVLKFLRQEGCPWNKWTSMCAALGGHLEVLNTEGSFVRLPLRFWNVVVFLVDSRIGHACCL